MHMLNAKRYPFLSQAIHVLRVRDLDFMGSRLRASECWSEQPSPSKSEPCVPWV